MENKNPKILKTKKEEKYFHQNVWCVIVKNRDLSNAKS